MKKLFPAAAIALLVITFNANASQAQFALPDSISGTPVSQLAFSGTETSIAPTAISGPSAMNVRGHTYTHLHVGTNSDLYIDEYNVAQSWIAYTLDASSGNSGQRVDYDGSVITYPITPITGTLWLSFNTNTQIYKIYFDRVSSPYEFTATNFSPFPNQSPVSALIGGGRAYPHELAPGTNASIPLPHEAPPCIECNYLNNLNLAFLELRWTDIGYNLFLNSQGFDQVLSYNMSFNGSTSQTAFNIAPVPLPASAWLLASTLTSLCVVRRRLNKN